MLLVLALVACVQVELPMNVTRAHVDITGCLKSGISTRCTTYGELLSSEVFRRSKVSWTVEPTGSSRSTSIRLSIDPHAGIGREGYAIAASSSGNNVTVVAQDETGLLFGIGRLLRALAPVQSEGYKVGPSRSVILPMPVSIASAPSYKLRGHQLGYRPKTNSYDGWSADDYEQYVVDLAIFGTNMIELIPWKTDDVAYSPMFTQDPGAMLAAVSAAVDKYGLQCGLWYPMMEKDYSDRATLNAAKEEWEHVFDSMKRLDMVQIPAGDPGKRPPNELLAIAEIFSGALKKKFPAATLWIGPQEWSPSEMVEWNEAIATGVEWIDGLVYGPHTNVDLQTFIATSPKRFPVRLYPDLTHSLTTQYPVPEWDRALAVTESRESINPRPTQFAWIAAQHLALTNGVGFSSYSEGCHDDVNKMLWSAVAWGDDHPNPASLATTVSPTGAVDVQGSNDAAGTGAVPRAAADAAVKGRPSSQVAADAVYDWANVFGSPLHASNITAIVLGLEQAWVGALETNTGIAVTLARVLDFELEMQPIHAYNWRLQQVRYRAYYDAFVYARYTREMMEDREAQKLLINATSATVQHAIVAATAMLQGAHLDFNITVAGKTEADLRLKVHVLAGHLFHSIKMQLSVTEYFGEYSVRGANLDSIDLPLVNQNFLLDALAAAAALPAGSAAQLAAVRTIAGFEDPGPGGYYDDLGARGKQPHLVRPLSWADDPDYYQNPLSACAIAKDVHWTDRLESPPLSLPRIPMQWQTTVTTFYNAPLTLRYTNLSAGGNYSVAVVYVSENVYVATPGGRHAGGTVGASGQSTPPAVTMLTANGVVVHALMPPPQTAQRLHFLIPAAAVAHNTSLELQWTMAPNAGGSGAGNYVAEVMLQLNL